MFKQKANTAFNNTTFTSLIITTVYINEVRDMHDHMVRLYRAAKELANADGQSAVAKLLNVSPQRVNNWEARGISSEGLLEAQKVIGCNAIWIRDGTGSMSAGDQRSTPGGLVSIHSEEAASDLAYITSTEAKLLTAYRTADARRRAEIAFAAGLKDMASQAGQSSAQNR